MLIPFSVWFSSFFFLGWGQKNNSAQKASNRCEKSLFRWWKKENLSIVRSSIHLAAIRLLFQSVGSSIFFHFYFDSIHYFCVFTFLSYFNLFWINIYVFSVCVRVSVYFVRCRQNHCVNERSRRDKEKLW